MDKDYVAFEPTSLSSVLIGLKSEGHIDEKLAPRKIISHFQELLGVQQLSRLRSAVVQAAIDALERKA